MIMAVGLTVAKSGRGRRSDGSGHNETDCNSLKCGSGLYVIMPPPLGGALSDDAI